MYYFINIQILEDGTSPKTIAEYDNFDDADAQLHYEMWYAKSNKDNFKSIKCLILNERGNTIKLDIWDKPVPIPVEEETNEEEPNEEESNEENSNEEETVEEG